MRRIRVWIGWSAAASLGENMPVPFFIIDGRSDPLAPPDLAARYLRAIRAPEKGMFLINGGHFAFMSDSDEFLQVLVQHVRPLCLPSQSRPAAGHSSNLSEPMHDQPPQPLATA